MSTEPNIIEQVSANLVLRTATRDDAEKLADFHEEVFMDEESGTRAWWIAEWGRDLLTKPHPTFAPSDCLIVEDTATHQIASSCLYLTQQWQTDGVTFNIGKPEIVGTRKPYRDQGLIRKQFDIMHRWAEQRGHYITIIDGIPHYYRQFGYDMAINNLASRQSRLEAYPRWKPDEQRAYILRDATPDDLPAITDMLNASAHRSLYHPVFKADELGYAIFDRSERSAVRWTTAMICPNSADGPAAPVGVIFYALTIAIDQAVIGRIEIPDNRRWRKAVPAVLREFEERARNASTNHPDPDRSIKHIRTEMQNNHPAYIFDEGTLGPKPDNLYAWYVRVPDLPRFLTKLAPALNKRLANSVHAGYSDTININLGRSGIALTFSNGQLYSATETARLTRKSTNASFPNGNFNQVLFGRRSIADVIRTDADAFAKSTADHHLIQTLFPNQTSDLSLTVA